MFWQHRLLPITNINYETVEPWPLERHDFDVKAEARRQKESLGRVEEPEGDFAG
jgi:hypothetical protein